MDLEAYSYQLQYLRLAGDFLEEAEAEAIAGRETHAKYWTFTAKLALLLARDHAQNVGPASTGEVGPHTLDASPAVSSHPYCEGRR